MNLVRHRGDSVEATTKKHKQTLNRDKRCPVGIVHLADTRKQAIENAGRRGRTQQEVAETIGRFGCYFLVANDFSNWEATRKHYGLFASCVVPAFQPSQERLLAAERYAISRRAELEAANGAAIQARTGQNAVGVARSGTSPWVRDEKSAVQIAPGGAGRYVAQGIRYS